jgi:thiamine-phosphate pyrophosphorylase
MPDSISRSPPALPAWSSTGLLSKRSGARDAAGLVGKSTHSAADAQAAAEDGADIVLLGPIFPTPSKRGSPLTPSVLDAMGPWPAPAELFLIGGIDRERMGSLRSDAGRFTGVAAIRLFEDAEDPGAVVQEARGR